MKDQSFESKYLPEERKIDIKKELSYYLFFWPWFIAAVFVTCAFAFIYIRYADRVYESNAQIQIKEAESDPASFLTGGAEMFGFDKVNVENDIAVIKSYHILSQVVKRLDLQTSVQSKGRVNNKLLFAGSIPFQVKFADIIGAKTWEVNVDNGFASVSDDSLSFSLLKGEELNNNFIYIAGQDSLFEEDKSFVINHSALNVAVSRLKSSLNVVAASKKGEIINLSIRGTNTNLNEAILNTLLEVIAEDQVSDKQEVSEVSIAFIDKRLQGLRKSIDTISQNTISYQMDNDIFDPETQTGNALENIIKGQEEAFSLGIQLEIAKGLKEQIEAQTNFDILPANVGIDNESVNHLVNSYNEVVVQRNTLLVSATDQSPVVLQLSNQLHNSRRAIITGVSRYIEGLDVSLSNYRQMENQKRGLVAGMPNKGNVLRSYARNFKIVEDLYVFLLQRKEEASISYISALPNLKVLSYGITGGGPITPKSKISYLIAIFSGLAIPFGVLLFLKLLDTKINTREELESGLNGATILGEVPFAEHIESDSDQRSITAESTRVLRSSLSFMLKKQGTNIINVTSTTKGEGKSFISYNLAASYRALGKKVILLGADLRNPQLHNRIGIKRLGQGLSTYLSDENFKDIDAIITKGKGAQEMDYLLSGAIPPNPAELLMRPRMQELLDILKEMYEVIIIDSAPLLLVSDTSSLLPLSDVVVYVVRAQYSDKNILPFIAEQTAQPDNPPFGFVLNGLIAGPSSNFSYRYRYSYSYKYNYGYGYGYGEDK
ncbi:MAG: capsular exopolysaccharide synthesis family protein [Glaciecola sp.]|jgi:capsular exopolysaccharide synthesis family protein